MLEKGLRTTVVDIAMIHTKSSFF